MNTTSFELSKNLRSSFGNRTLVALASTMVLAMSAVLHWATPYMAVATLSYFILCMGVVLRRNRKLHPYFMMTGAGLDILLVLVLELQRSAIATAVGGKLNLAQMGHIGFSLLAVLCYIPAILYGRSALEMSQNQTQTHRIWGRTAFALRTLGFFLMFSMLEIIKR